MAARLSLRYLPLVLVYMAWLPALALQKTGWFPYFGSLWLSTLGVAALLTLMALASELLLKHKPDLTSTVAALLFSLLGGWLWTPVLNGLLDFSDTVTVDGTIEIKTRTGRRDQRILTVEVEGNELTTEIDPSGFWESQAVRMGGPCRVRLGRGAFGAIRPSAIRDPERHPTSRKRRSE